MTLEDDPDDPDGLDDPDESDPDNPDQKLITRTVNFASAKAQEPNFVRVTSTNEDDEPFSLFVDLNSGLICINPFNANCEQVPVTHQLRSFGRWDNDLQEPILNDDVMVYSYRLNIMPYDENEFKD
jgi:hypothetical protein